MKRHTGKKLRLVNVARYAGRFIAALIPVYLRATEGNAFDTGAADSSTGNGH